MELIWLSASILCIYSWSSYFRLCPLSSSPSLSVSLFQYLPLSQRANPASTFRGYLRKRIRRSARALLECFASCCCCCCVCCCIMRFSRNMKVLAEKVLHIFPKGASSQHAGGVASMGAQTALRIPLVKFPLNKMCSILFGAAWKWAWQKLRTLIQFCLFLANFQSI